MARALIERQAAGIIPRKPVVAESFGGLPDTVRQRRLGLHLLAEHRQPLLVDVLAGLLRVWPRDQIGRAHV